MVNNNINHQGSFMLSRVDFKPDSFDTIIGQKGFRVKWEQGMFCSCYADSGQPDYNCQACRGKGYVYFDPKQTRALVTSIHGRKEQETIGLDDKGSAYLTPLSTDNVGFRDKFTFMDFTTKYSQVVTKGIPGDLDELRYPVLESICLRRLGQIYKQGIDFKLSKDKLHIEWITELIAEGESYSILYTTHPVYIAINPIHELRGTYSLFKGRGNEYFVPLPKQYQIKREDFIENDY